MPDVTLDLGNQYIGSAYSPQVAITETETGHEIDFTFADSEHPGQLKTEGFEVPNYVSEEAEREAAEAERAAAESARAAAEEGRMNRELDRVFNENARINAEELREDAETARAAAEQARASAETARAGAEASRASAEQARTSAESARASAESGRATAESARVSAEQARATAESARDSAEAARESAESTRQTDTAAAIARADAATAAANTATTNAQTATMAAQAATGETETATGAANAAAALATAAAETVTDAYFPMFTAGAAEGITGGGPTDTAAWTYRACPGTDGPATIESIHGRTVRWNQRVGQDVDAISGNQGTRTFDSDTKVWTIASTVSGGTSFGFYTYPAATRGALGGHKSLLCADVKLSTAGTARIGVTGSQTEMQVGTDFTHIATIVSPASDAGMNVYTTGADGLTMQVKNVQIFDLTAMFGSGNEPSTVAEFEAMYPDAYYAYSAPTLQPVRMTGVESAGDGWHFQRAIDAGVLRGAGTVYDELTADERIVRVGERAYQSGDESDPSVVTDGTTTHYALATPTTTPIDPALNMTYRAAAGGTERILHDEPTAPPTLVIQYGSTADGIRDRALACIAHIENGKASANYGVGSYLIHAGQLCRVTTAIATGEAITIGTNVTATTVMAELLTLTQ